jgi:hypothetical protein
MLWQKLIGGAAAGTTLSAEFLSDITLGTGASQSFTDVGFGAEDTTRRIYVMVSFIAASGTVTVDSATIGGVSATLVSSSTASTSVRGSGLFAVDLPTGASGTVSFVFSGSLSTAAQRAYVYRVTNQDENLGSVLESTGATTVTSAFGTATSVSRTESTAAGGFALAVLALTASRTATLNTTQQFPTTSSFVVSGLLVPTTGSNTTFTGTWSSGVAAATMRVFSLRK